MGRRGYPLEFRRRALDLIEAGRKVVDVARDLEVSEQTLYAWRRQDRIDRGLEPGTTSLESAALVAANKRIQLETEVAIARRAVELVKEPTDPKRRFAALAVMAAEGLTVQVACRNAVGVRIGLLRRTLANGPCVTCG
jgi:putative transposase